MCRFMYVEAFLKNVIEVTYYHAHLRYARFAYPWFCISVRTVKVLFAATVATAAHAQ
jgi:hypothetical protein